MLVEIDCIEHSNHEAWWGLALPHFRFNKLSLVHVAEYISTFLPHGAAHHPFKRAPAGRDWPLLLAPKGWSCLRCAFVESMLIRTYSTLKEAGRRRGRAYSEPNMRCIRHKMYPNKKHESKLRETAAALHVLARPLCPMPMDHSRLKMRD